MVRQRWPFPFFLRNPINRLINSNIINVNSNNITNEHQRHTTLSMLISTPRVTQLDAFLLDNELFSHLLDQLSNAVSSERKAELSLLLRLVLYKLTLWDKSQSYGMFLMNLKYEDLHTIKKAAYFAWVVMSGYLNEKVSGIVYDEDGQGERWRKMWKLGEKTVKVSEFVNLLVFLVKGDHPSLALRLLNVKIAVNSIELAKANKGSVSYEFQNRQLVWNTFLEFIIFILPIFRNSGVNSIFTKLLQRPSKVQDQVEFKHLKERECAICFEAGKKQRITNPYQMECGCKYCYVCAVTKLEQAKTTGEHWRCLKCGAHVDHAAPFEDVDTKAIKFELPQDPVQHTEKIGEDVYDEPKEEDDDEEVVYDDEKNDLDLDDDFQHDEFDEMDDDEALDDEEMYQDDL